MPSDQATSGKPTRSSYSYSYSEEYEGSPDYSSYTPTNSSNKGSENKVKENDEYYSYSDTNQKKSGDYYSYSDTNGPKSNQEGDMQSGDYYSYTETNQQKRQENGNGHSGEYYSYTESGGKKGTPAAEGQSDDYYSYSETNLQKSNPDDDAQSNQDYSYSETTGKEGKHSLSYYSYTENDYSDTDKAAGSTYYSYTRSSENEEDKKEEYEYTYKSTKGGTQEKSGTSYSTTESNTASDYSAYYSYTQNYSQERKQKVIDSYSYTEGEPTKTIDSTYYTYDDSYRRQNDSYSETSPNYDYYSSSKYTDSYSERANNASTSYYTGRSYYYSSSYPKNMDDGSYVSETDGATTDNEYSSDAYTYSSLETTEKRSSEQESRPAHQLLSKHQHTSIVSSSEYSPNSTPLSSKHEVKLRREYLVIRAPQEVFPKFFPPPSSCYVSDNSPDDFIHDFMDRLTESNVRNEIQHTLTAFEVGKVNTAEKKQKGRVTSSDRLSEDETYLNQKNLRCALKILQLGHVERKEVTKDLMSSTEANSFSKKFRSVIETQVKKKVIGSFVSHDLHRTGEITLEAVVGILLAMGIGRGPVIDNYRISICLENNTVMLCVEYFEHGLTEKPQKYLFDACPGSTKQHGDLSLRFSVSHSSLTVGKDHLKFLTQNTVALNRLKQYCIAYSYLSVVVQQCVFQDRTGGFHIHYSHLVRAILVMMCPPPSRVSESVTSIFLSNAFRSIYFPVEALREYLPIPVPISGLGVIQAESALLATTDSKQKTRRNVVPPIKDSRVVEVSLPTHESSNFIEVSIKKVRVPAPIPEGCRPYCLVSAVSAESAFLPAVRIPVAGVRSSTKDGFTWTFGNKETKDNCQIFLIRGSNTDRLYIECCYEERNTVTVNNVSRVDTTVWCAGYCSVLLSDLQSTTLAVCPGSLLDPPSAEENCEKGKHGSKKKKTSVASGVKIEVSKASKEVNKSGALLPERCILLKRHLNITAELRVAITHLGVSQSTHAIQAFRHQYAEKAFLVSSNVELMDDLKKLWDARKAKMTKKERELPHHDLLLQCAAGIAAAFNCSNKPFSSSIISHRKLQFNHFAPSDPIQR